MKGNAPASVRRLLFRWLLLPLGVLLALAAVLAYPLALYPATAAYDWALMDTALSLSQLIGQTKPGESIRISRSADILLRTDQYDRIYYSVHDTEGRLLAGDAELAMPERQPTAAGELIYDGFVHRQPVRIAARYTRVHDMDVVVQVAETWKKRQMLIYRILTSMVATEILVLVVALLLVWFGIAKGMQPLERLRAELEARSSRDLRPVEESHAPVELRAVVKALNDLLQRLESALQAQQRFVANVAHQLRTPLAGLRMHVETALQQDAPAKWRRLLQPLKSATERATHLVNQLLVLARAEANTIQAHAASEFDLSDVVQEVAAQSVPRAIAKGMDLGLELSAASLRGDKVLVAELLRNLLENAITYAPSGARITVRTRREDEFVVLEVEDNGSGIPVHERANVMKRFYRLEGSPGDGCGLGLAIVQEIAQIHGGSAEITHPLEGSGTVVVVRFPAGAAVSAMSDREPVEADADAHAATSRA